MNSTGSKLTNSPETEVGPVSLDVQWRAILVVVVVVLLGYFFASLRDVLLLLFIGGILATALTPLVTTLAAWRIPRPVSLVTIGLILVGLMVAVVSNLGPLASREFSQVLDHVAQSARQAQSGTTWWATTLTKGLDMALRAIPQWLGTTGMQIFQGVIGSSISIIFLIFLVYALVVKPRQIQTLADWLTPDRNRARVHRAIDDLEHRLGRWLRGQLLVSLFVAIMVGVGLSLLHVPDAFVLSLIAGGAEFVPAIGPYIGMVPAAILALTISPWRALWVFVLFYGVQQIENNILTPKVMGQAVGLKPIVIIIALLTGAKLFGLLGFALAVPSCIVIQTIIHNIRLGASKPA